MATQGDPTHVPPPDQPAKAPMASKARTHARLVLLPSRFDRLLVLLPSLWFISVLIPLGSAASVNALILSIYDFMEWRDKKTGNLFWSLVGLTNWLIVTWIMVKTFWYAWKFLLDAVDGFPILFSLMPWRKIEKYTGADDTNSCRFVGWSCAVLGCAIFVGAGFSSEFDNTWEAWSCTAWLLLLFSAVQFFGLWWTGLALQRYLDAKRRAGLKGKKIGKILEHGWENVKKAGFNPLLKLGPAPEDIDTQGKRGIAIGGVFDNNVVSVDGGVNHQHGSERQLTLGTQHYIALGAAVYFLCCGVSYFGLYFSRYSMEMTDAGYGMAMIVSFGASYAMFKVATPATQSLWKTAKAKIGIREKPKTEAENTVQPTGPATGFWQSIRSRSLLWIVVRTVLNIVWAILLCYYLFVVHEAEPWQLGYVFILLQFFSSEVGDLLILCVRLAATTTTANDNIADDVAQQEETEPVEQVTYVKANEPCVQNLDMEGCATGASIVSIVHETTQGNGGANPKEPLPAIPSTPPTRTASTTQRPNPIKAHHGGYSTSQKIGTGFKPRMCMFIFVLVVFGIMGLYAVSFTTEDWKGADVSEDLAMQYIDANATSMTKAKRSPLLCHVPGTNLTLNDYAFLSAVSYYQPSEVQELLDLYYGANITTFLNPDDPLTPVSVPKTDLAVVYYFRYWQEGHMVASIRGSYTGFDWLVDFNLWGEVAIYQVVNRFVFLPWLWSVLVPRAIWLGQIFGVGDMTSYYEEIIKAIQAMAIRTWRPPVRKFTLTGHSLGGGVASIIAGRLNVTAVAFSGPGVEPAHLKFKVRPQDVNDHVINVIPELDIVPRTGEAVTYARNIPCNSTVFGCHSIFLTFCTLQDLCGVTPGRKAIKCTPPQ